MTALIIFILMKVIDTIITHAEIYVSKIISYVCSTVLY